MTTSAVRPAVGKSVKVVFVTMFCPHYRVRTFETLARYFDMEYLFFSSGDEWFWQREHGVQAGAFRHRYLPSFRLGPARVAPSLPTELWRGRCDVYVKCINGRFAVPITYLVARLRRKPFVLWTGVWARLGTFFHRLALPLTLYLYRHADAVVVYGDHVKRYLVSEGVVPERVFVAAHAVDNEAYRGQPSDEEMRELRAALRVSPKTPVVLFLGRLEPEKGLPVLIRAFRDVARSDAVLVIAGTGSQTEAIRRQVRALGLGDRVRMPGYVRAAEAYRYYVLATVYVLPSITLPTFKEPWGLVVNEAFNAGVPVIASDAVGAAAGGLIRDGVNGYVVPEGDVSTLTKRLDEVLGDPELRTRLSRGARHSIDEWDNDRMVLGFRRAIAYVTGAAEPDLDRAGRADGVR